MSEDLGATASQSPVKADSATEIARDLREIADWLDEHPQYTVYANNALYITSANTRDDIAQLARDLGNCKKEYSGSSFYLKRFFGAVEVWATLPREEVCRRVVVGTKIVPAVEAVPEHEEEDVEWICDEPLLAPTIPEPQSIRV